MKILWLCNVAFTTERIKTTASWLQPMAEALQQSGKVQIINITQGSVNNVQQSDFCGINQYILPKHKTKKWNQVASIKTCQEIAEIEAREQPDLVHIWGTERIWASVYEQGYIQTKTIIDIQGILFTCYPYYYGGLTFKEITKCIHLKELIMPWRTLSQKKKVFRKRSETEIRCLKKFEQISYQSEWVKNHIRIVNPTAQYHATKIMLRQEFYTATPWKYKENLGSPKIFTIASSAITYKGIHIALKAIALLKNQYPDIKFYIAGNMNLGNRLLDGYAIFLHQLIRYLKLETNVDYLGNIDSKTIIRYLQQSNVCVIPSFVETYCLAFAEAMLIGTPTVVSYAGAMPELANHQQEALFYNSLDYTTCSAYIDMLINNKALAEKLSARGRARRLKENDPTEVVQTQIGIYKSVLNNI